MHTKTWLIFLCFNIALIGQFKVTNARPTDDDEKGSVTESPIIFQEENSNSDITKEAEAQQEVADNVVEEAVDEDVDEDLVEEVVADDDVVTEKPDDVKENLVEVKEEIEQLEAQLDRLDQSSSSSDNDEETGITTIASVITSSDPSVIEEKSDPMEEEEEVVVEKVVVEAVDKADDQPDDEVVEDAKDDYEVVEEVVIEAVDEVIEPEVEEQVVVVLDEVIEKSTKVPVNLDRSDYAQPRKVEPEISAKPNDQPIIIKEDSVKQESSNSKKTNTTGLRMEIIIAFAVMGVLLFICFVIITYLMCKNKKSSKKSVDGSGYYPNYNIRIPHLPDPRQAARYSYTNTYPGNYFYTKYPASHPYIPHY